jgi:hypothetical protein
LPSEQTGVVYLRKQNVFLCNGVGCAHPADMPGGFYYPLRKGHVKQLRRAAAKAEKFRRRALVAVPVGHTPAGHRKEFFRCWKMAVKARRNVAGELAHFKQCITSATKDGPPTTCEELDEQTRHFNMANQHSATVASYTGHAFAWLAEAAVSRHLYTSKKFKWHE